MDRLQQGGNAVDAAVAAALMLGVVDGFNSGIGGGCLILLHTADGRLVAIDGRETAPGTAHPDLFVRNGQAVAELSQTGPLAVAVPGALAAYDWVVRHYGKQRLAEHLLPAANIAEQGFEISDVYHDALVEAAPSLAEFPAAKAIFLGPSGDAPDAGAVLKQIDLAQTYRSIAEHGTKWFYHGPFAQQTGEWMAANGGILRADDFTQYQPQVRQPIATQYRDYTIVGFPPPSSGGILVAQMLQMLEPYAVSDVAAMNHPAWVHLMVEVMKRAFADRAYWLGDADFVGVPRGLLDPQYARKRIADFDPQHAATVVSQGEPPRAEEDQFQREKHTTHLVTADSAGNWVAITATINTTFGSKVVIPGTGVVLNNEMDDFSAKPGAANAFGLIGGDRNAIAPGKRPLSSMSPTLVLQQGKPWMALGAAGGPKIITQVLSVLVRVIDLHQPLDVAVAASRFHHQWSPDRLYLEPSFGDAERAALAKLGHQLQSRDSLARLQAIQFQADGKTMMSVADPRVQGAAAAY